MLPFLGQGGAMAIEDAYVLSRELARSADDIPRALRAYEAERIPRTAKVQLAVRRQAKIFHLGSPVARTMRQLKNYLPSLGAYRSIDFKADWLYEYDATV
jgi:salicylate hydroxylase